MPTVAARPPLAPPPSRTGAVDVVLPVADVDGGVEKQPGRTGDLGSDHLAALADGALVESVAVVRVDEVVVLA